MGIRPTLPELAGMGDFATVYQWGLVFIKYPTVGLFPRPDAINLRCESTSIPKTTNQKIETKIRGHAIRQPGIVDYDGQIILNFVETVDNTISMLITAWREACWLSLTGAQTPKWSLDAIMQIVRLDRMNLPIWQYVLYGCFLEDADMGQLDGSTSENFKPSITLSYDYFMDGPIGFF